MKSASRFGYLAIEDAHRAHQRPKIEAYGETLFIVLRTAQMNDQKIELGETHFFLGSNFIVTVRHGSSLAYTDGNLWILHRALSFIQEVGLALNFICFADDGRHNLR